MMAIELFGREPQRVLEQRLQIRDYFQHVAFVQMFFESEGAWVRGHKQVEAIPSAMAFGSSLRRNEVPGLPQSPRPLRMSV